MNFKYGVLETFTKEITAKDLVEKENYWIARYKTNNPRFGYNKRITAESSKGIRHSEATRAKLAKRLSPGTEFGRLSVVEDSEYYLPCKSGFRKVLFRCACGTTKWIFLSNVKSGKQRSCGCLHRDPKTIAKIKATLRKYFKNPKNRERVRLSLLGKKASAETRAKMSASQRKRPPPSKETIEKRVRTRMRNAKNRTQAHLYLPPAIP